VRRQNGNTAALVLLGILCFALLSSLALNAYFWNERDDLLQKEATVKQLQVDTKAAAQACSASVENLAKEGKARDGRLAVALAKIAPQVKLNQQEVLKALAARPDNPNDLCGSLQRFLSRSIKAEREAK
jgi:hypothetical protein